MAFSLGAPSSPAGTISYCTLTPVASSRCLEKALTPATS